MLLAGWILIKKIVSYRLCMVMMMHSMLSGCSSIPEEPKIPFVYTITTTADINPDIKGQASSVVVRVFQLTAIGNFTAARYEDIFSQSYEKLGTEFIAVNEHLVTPSSMQNFHVDISERTKFLGIAVGFRSAQSVVWKTTRVLPQKSLLKDPLGFLSARGIIISVNELSVSVTGV